MQVAADIVSNCPFPVASLIWRSGRTTFVTVIAKATYRLAPGVCPLHDQQEPALPRDRYYDEGTSSLYCAADLVPFKPSPEVTLVGSAFAPKGKPVARLATHIIVGGIEKTVMVHADRSIGPDGALRTGTRFARMPLRYELAAGGPGSKNPVGIARSPDATGAVRLPNLEPPGLMVTQADDGIEPIGYGPLAAEWPERQARLGSLAGRWTAAALAAEPMPDGIDPRFFMAAPADQRLERLRPDERIVLGNLHREQEHLVTRLPGHQAEAAVERPNGEREPLPMSCDTLWIDTDRAICTVTWRARLKLGESDAGVRIAVGAQLDEHDEPLTQRGDHHIDQTRTISPHTVPALKEPRERWPSWLERDSAAASPAPVAPAQVEPAQVEQRRALPFGAEAATRSAGPAPPRPSAPTASAGAAPPRPSAPGTLGTLAGRPPIPLSMVAAATAAAQEAVAIARPAQPKADVKAQEKPQAPQEQPKPRGVWLDLVWFAAEQLPRLRAMPALFGRPADASWIAPAKLARRDAQKDPRCEIAAALSQAEPADQAGMRQAMTAAFDDGGGFAAPVAVIDGELCLGFDPVEALRATLAVVQPVAGSEKKVKDASGQAGEALQSPWPMPLEVAEELTRRLEEAFAQGTRSAPGYLEQAVERMLLERRRYCQKTLFGGDQLRALWTLRDGSAMPCYLPAAVAPSLPLYRRFEARAVAELRWQEDPYETQDRCLRLLALGRVLKRP